MKTFYVWIIFLFLATTLTAQKITNYTTASTNGGLCDNEVNAIYIYNSGSNYWAWFATKKGYSMSIVNCDWWVCTRYGRVLKSILSDNNQYLIDNCINAMADDGIYLWLGTNGGVTKDALGGGHNRDFTMVDGLIDNHVNAVAVAARRIKWFGTNNGVSMFNDAVVPATWTSYTTADGLIDNHINAIAVDGADTKWFGTNVGVSALAGTIWTSYTTANGLVDNKINAIAVDAAGNKWFATDNGVSCYNGSSWTTYTTADGLASNTVHSISIDAAGNKWFGTTGGASKFNSTNNTWLTYTTANGLVNNDVHAIAFHQDGSLWFGTYGGVSKFNGYSWINTTANGLPAYLIRQIQIDKDNNKWISNYAGVTKFDGVTWTTYTGANSNLTDVGLDNFVYDAQGTKWFPAKSGGIASFDGTTWTIYSNTSALGKNTGAIAIDAQGNKWLGQIGGISMFDGTTWTSYPIGGLETSFGVYKIAIDAENIKWVCTGRGIYKFDGTTCSTFYSGSYIYDVAIDQQDTKWFVVGTNIYSYDNVSWKFYQGAQYIPNNSIYSVSIDLLGNKWFGGSGGLTKFDGTTWKAYTSAANGLPNNCAYYISVDLDGVKWLGYGGSYGGIAKFDDRYVTLSGTSVALTADASSTGSFGVSSNTRWAVSGNPAWLSLSTASGSANATINLTAAANPSTSDRMATITVTSSDQSTQTVTVTQAGRVIIPVPNISIQGNAVTIANNDDSPSFSDYTNFGSAEVTIGTATRAFTIQNSGDGTLTFPASVISIAGANASDFQISTYPSGDIASGASGSLVVTFTPTAEGTRTATIAIASNDATQNPYRFSVQGTGVIPRDIVVSGVTVPAAANGIYSFQGISNEFAYWKNTVTGYYVYNKSFLGNRSWNIDADTDDTHVAFFSNDHAEDPSPVSVAFWPIDRGSGNSGTPVITYREPRIYLVANSVEIQNNDITPTTNDNTDFGALDLNATPLHKSFTIKNNGTLPLILTGIAPYVQITGVNAGDFSVTVNPAVSIAADGATNFEISFLPGGGGLRSATVSIGSNAGNATLYSFKIQGTGLAPTVISTQAVDGISTVSATGHGTVVSVGYPLAAQHGLVWSTTPHPTIDLSTKSEEGAVSSVLSFTNSITGLTPGTKHYIRAYATNSSGTVYGDELSFSTTVGLPAVPAAVTAAPGNAQAAVSFTVPTSDGGSAITGYTVKSSPGNLTAAGNTSPITMTGLTNGTSYSFTVTATNSAGTSVTSAPSNAVTPFGAPLATTIAANAITTSGGTLNGTINPNGASTAVRFEYGLTPNYGATVLADQSPFAGSEGVSVSKMITGLSPNTSYHYRVVGVNAAGTVAGSDQIFTTALHTAQENVVENGFSIYPNPATDGFTINAGDQPAVVSVYDQSGNLLLTQQVVGKTYISISSLRPGVYVVKANGHSVKLVKK